MGSMSIRTRNVRFQLQVATTEYVHAHLPREIPAKKPDEHHVNGKKESRLCSPYLKTTLETSTTVTGRGERSQSQRHRDVVKQRRT